MLVLITIFIIACAGIILLLGFKLAEERLERRLFLPEWLVRRDGGIERAVRFFAHAFLWWVKHKARTLIHLLHQLASRLLFRAVKRIRSRRPARVLQKDGAASSYMKDIALHKEAAHRENGRTE
jgi:hypothetical protein